MRKRAWSLLASAVRPSVCVMSVRHFHVLYPDGWRYRQLLPRPGIPIFLVYWPSAVHNSEGNSFIGALNTRGWGKLAIFHWNRRLSRKRYEIGPLLLWNFNKKSSVADRSVSVSMTLSDHERRGVIFQSDLLNNARTVWLERPNSAR